MRLVIVKVALAFAFAVVIIHHLNILPLNLLAMGGKQSSPEGNCTQFSVLSWNVWFGSRDAWDQPKLRWSKLLDIAVSKNPDIIGFQECTADFLQVAGDHPKFSKLYEPVNKRPIERYFVMVYKSKSLEKVTSETIELKTRLGRRCESVTVKKCNSLFRFGTVHIESLVTSPNIREIQMETIFNTLQKSPDGLQLAFLVGDFNFDETDKENEFLEKSVFTDTWPVLHQDDKGYSFENKNNLMNKHAVLISEKITEIKQMRLDRIVYWTNGTSDWVPKNCQLLGTKSFDSIVIPGDGTKVPLFPSDHYGLYAKFVRKIEPNSD